ncbi:hypothetical protein PYCCODRAFT_1270521 [Trametes coccinea BRFM310]|uniref:Uncharacterized protein n=1 Tax=Trametes coccinea (strain BRFM310) TaxID=1353009 RepID=A0A1Y2IV09_TRAC3|nr:hypothetical protein PYCCODRAFT_1270521 [Trametes coccinea BRFM310]
MLSNIPQCTTTVSTFYSSLLFSLHPFCPSTVVSLPHPHAISYRHPICYYSPPRCLRQRTLLLFAYRRPHTHTHNMHCLHIHLSPSPNRIRVPSSRPVLHKLRPVSSRLVRLSPSHLTSEPRLLSSPQSSVSVCSLSPVRDRRRPVICTPYIPYPLTTPRFPLTTCPDPTDSSFPSIPPHPGRLTLRLR